MKTIALLLLSALVVAEDKVIPPLPQHFEYILDGRRCNNEPITVAVGEHFHCKGVDKEHLMCSGIDITVHGKVDECLQIHVIKDDPKIKETK